MTTKINIISIEKQLLSLNIFNQISNDKLTEYQHDILVGVIATLAEMKHNLEAEDVISILDIVPKDIPKSLEDKIAENEVYTYMDGEDTQEHLYSIDGITEKLRQLSIKITKEERRSLESLQKQMNDKNCSYFRIINF